MDMDFSYPNPGQMPRYDSPHNAYGSSSFHSNVGQTVGPPFRRPPPPVPANSASRVGIRVALKPEYQVSPPPQLLPEIEDVPHSSFHFDFDLERRILQEAENEGHLINGSIHVKPSSTRTGEASAASKGSVEDPGVSKYTAMGLNKEAVVLALATFGDVQTKVLDFVPSYNRLREMGFPSDAVAGALAMYDNDKERALAHLVA